MKLPIVSIVTPSYNGAAFLDNYFKCILSQTYNNIELILINNGSTDNSDDIVNKYKEKLYQKGVRFVYLKIEKNEGPLKAINEGLAHITGDYFSEIDVDDSMHIDYIEKKAAYFLENPDTDILITPCDMFDINDKEHKIGTIWKKPFENKNELIDRYLLSKDVGYMGGAYMMKTESFFKIYTDHKIFEDSKVWGFATMLYFPLIYRGNAQYMNEVLFDYYLHANNLHIVSEKRNLEVLHITYDNVLKQINATTYEYNEVMHKVNIYVTQELLGVAFKENNRKEFRKLKKELNKLGGCRFKDTIKAVIISSGFLYRLYFKMR